MNNTITITRAEYKDLQARSDALCYITGVMDLKITDKAGMQIQLDVIAKKIEPFAINRVKETATVMDSEKEVSNA